MNLSKYSAKQLSNEQLLCTCQSDLLSYYKLSKNDLGIIIEFKKTLTEDNNDLELAAQRLLAQIKQKYYAQERRS